ncbi:MAG: PD-(D/E)XK nuclease family protein [Paludibacteraceae bacterium]|nr:PD-(D/E)XK nuclease family protein [Paludibacteraceae bacterium]
MKKIFSNNVNENNFVTYLSDVISQLQSLWEEGHNDLEKAFAFCYITVLNRVNTQIDKSNLSVSFSSLYLILKQLVRNVKIPFEGEPLSGLQIMGVLETRSLDFENLIITSLNEDIFPKKQSSDSSIPYALRKAFGLPTYEHQDALQAYYFYRLIASAKRVFLLYDSRADKISDHGEMSRFIYQLCYRYKQIQLEDEKKLSYSVATNGDKVVEVKKTKEILDELAKKRFSASALNEYFSCPLKFYFSRVANIDEKEELSEKIENNVFGSIVHYTLELLYNKYKNQEVTAEQIDLMLKDKKNLEDCLKKSFSKEYLNKDEIVEPKGRFKLVLEIIKKYVERVLEFDKKKTPFTYIESEKSVNVSFSIGKRAVNFYGKIDRLHKKDGTTHVVDYKTGSSKKMDSKDIDFLFDKDERSKKDLAAVFQTIFYSLLLRLGGEKGEIQPDIYYIRSLFDESVSPEIPCKFSEIEKEFKDNLSKLIEEIFDEKVSFTQANKDSNICKFCSYKIICGREDLKKNDF